MRLGREWRKSRVAVEKGKGRAAAVGDRGKKDMLRDAKKYIFF